MMKHMHAVHSHPQEAHDIAKMCDPDSLAKAAKDTGAAAGALCSIVARGHWTLVNGHWLRKQKDGSCVL